MCGHCSQPQEHTSALQDYSALPRLWVPVSWTGITAVYSGSRKPQSVDQGLQSPWIPCVPTAGRLDQWTGAPIWENAGEPTLLFARIMIPGAPWPSNMVQLGSSMYGMAKGTVVDFTHQISFNLSSDRPIPTCISLWLRLYPHLTELPGKNTTFPNCIFLQLSYWI